MVIFIQPEQRHYNARCAIPALAAVVVYHFLLYRVKQAIIGQVLDGNKLFTMNHGKENQATVDGFIPEFITCIFSNHHRAGSAIAFGTAFFHAFVER